MTRAKGMVWRGDVRDGTAVGAFSPVDATDDELYRCGVGTRTHLLAWELIVDDALVMFTASGAIHTTRTPSILKKLRQDPATIEALWLRWRMEVATLPWHAGIRVTSYIVIDFLRERFPALAARWQAPL